MSVSEMGRSGQSIVQIQLSQLALERRAFAEQRRLAYIVVGVIGTLLLLYDISSIVTSGLSYGWIMAANDAAFACCVVTFTYLGLTRRVPIDRLERLMFWLLALEAFVFNALTPWMFAVPIDRLVTETHGDDVWLLVLTCTMALQIFPHRSGLLRACALYSASALSVGAYLALLLGAGASAGQAASIVQSYVIGAMLLCFLYMLARYRDHVQRISLHTELLEQMAFVDTLTGLPNRSRMDALAQAQIDLAVRYGAPFCLALLDVDHFKRVNDTLGHLAGDSVLVRVASIGREAMRTTDQIGRWGGEEFLALMPQTSLAEGRAAIERVRLAVAAQTSAAGTPVTISCGVASFEAGDTTDSIVHRADAALYRAKAAGRDQVQSSPPA